MRGSRGGVLLVVATLSGCFASPPDAPGGAPETMDLEFVGTAGPLGAATFVDLCDGTNCPRHPFTVPGPRWAEVTLETGEPESQFIMDLYRGAVRVARFSTGFGTGAAAGQVMLATGAYEAEMVTLTGSMVEYRVHIRLVPPEPFSPGPIDGLSMAGIEGTPSADGDLTFRLTYNGPGGTTYAVPRDERVAGVAMSFTPSPDAPLDPDGDPAAITVTDDLGRVQCTVNLFLEPYACTVPVPRPGEAPWSLGVAADMDRFAPIGLEVTLVPEGTWTNLEPPADPAIRFRSHHTGRASGEDVVGVLADGSILVQQWVSTMRSRDDGATWERVWPRSPAWLTMDPYLRVDPVRGLVLVSHLYGGCAYLAISDDGGATWKDHPVSCGIPLNDHQKVASGPPPTVASDATLYYASSALGEIGTLQVSRSLDGGRTWMPSVVAGDSTRTGDSYNRNMGNIWADEEGNVYAASYHCPTGVSVLISHDHGATFSFGDAVEDPITCEDHDLGLFGDTAGNVYIAYVAGTRVHYVRSLDRGDTWEGPFDITPPGVGSVAQVALAAGDRGRLAVAYRGTPDTPHGPNRADGFAAWQTWVTFVTEADKTPVVRHAITEPADDPTQRGPICTYGIGCSGARNLLDFIGVAAGPDGRVYVSYSDGCAFGQCPSPADSRLYTAVVAIQESGPVLFEDGAPWAEAAVQRRSTGDGGVGPAP